MSNDINEMLLESCAPEYETKKKKRPATPRQLAALEKARAKRWEGHDKKKDSRTGAEVTVDILTQGETMPAAQPKINKLLPLITAEIGSIRKEQQNSHQRYRYRGIDDALNQVSPVLAKHGVCTEVEVTDHSVTRVEQGGNKKDVYHATLSLQIAFVAPDGSRIVSRAAGEGMSHGDDKATAKAMSGAMKYALFFGLMIPVDRNELEDPDATSEKPEPQESKAVAQARKMIKEASTLDAVLDLEGRITGSDVFSTSEKAMLSELYKAKKSEIELKG